MVFQGPIPSADDDLILIGENFNRNYSVDDHREAAAVEDSLARESMRQTGIYSDKADISV